VAVWLAAVWLTVASPGAPWSRTLRGAPSARAGSGGAAASLGAARAPAPRRTSRRDTSTFSWTLQGWCLDTVLESWSSRADGGAEREPRGVAQHSTGILRRRWHGLRATRPESPAVEDRRGPNTIPHGSMRLSIDLFSGRHARCPNVSTATRVLTATVSPIATSPHAKERSPCGPPAASTRRW